MKGKHSDVSCTNVFLCPSPKAKETKAKHKQMGSTQTLKLLHSKGNHRQNKKTIYRTGENIWK